MIGSFLLTVGLLWLVCGIIGSSLTLAMLFLSSQQQAERAIERQARLLLWELRCDKKARKLLRS